VKYSAQAVSAAIGHRVSVRIHSDNGYQDLLGVLEAPDSIRKRDGSLAHFDPRLVYAWRKVESISEVGKGLPLSLRIKAIELAAFGTWLPRHYEEWGSWHLRIDAGITKRANSILVLGDPHNSQNLEIENKIARAQKLFDQSRVPLVFMIPQPLGEKTQEFLLSNNWQITGEIFTLIGDATLIAPLDETIAVEVSDHPSSEWLAVEGDYALHDLFRRTPAFYISLRKAGVVVARGRIGFENSWGILTRIFVVENERGKKYGEAILRAAADIARSQEVRQLALHVDAENFAANSLYTKNGFRRHHSVHFYERVPDVLPVIGCC
jgi:GNAT superfamily N-acetyltransferase